MVYTQNLSLVHIWDLWPDIKWSELYENILEASEVNNEAQFELMLIAVQNLDWDATKTRQLFQWTLAQDNLPKTFYNEYFFRRLHLCGNHLNNTDIEEQKNCQTRLVDNILNNHGWFFDILPSKKKRPLGEALLEASKLFDLKSFKCLDERKRFLLERGVGRSTVLANLACWQAIKGRKILIIDLGLEAPGQHGSGLFKGNPVADSVIKGGFVDLCVAWQQHHDHERTHDEVYEWDLQDYMLRSAFLDNLPGADKGEIFLMPAGKKLDTAYARKLAGLDWNKFFSSSIKGYQLLAALKLHCKMNEFDWVFLDSRTGLSDPYYMATSWLSNTVVCFSLLNRQSIEGCSYAMDHILTEDSINKYGEKRILPVVTLIPPTKNFEVNNRIKTILADEWPEIDTGFVTEFRYDDALALEEEILATKDGFEKSDFGRSLLALDAALKTQKSYLMSRDQVRKRFRERTLENPFPNLRIEYWSPQEVANHYSVIYPEIEEQLTSFQPVIVYGSRGTGKTTMARYCDYQTQLIIFEQQYQRTPKPGELHYLGLWIRLDSDFLKAFIVPDEDKQKNYSALFGLFFDMVVLRKAVAVVIVNQGKSADTVARNMRANTPVAQDWYHNYSRGALYWLCTLYRKTKIYSGFNDIAGIAGGNIRVVVDIFYAIFAQWIKTEEERKLPFSYQLQNHCIHELSETYFRKLDRFRPTENQLNRLVERLGNLFTAIHKSPKQGEPEINHFSTNGALDNKTLKHLEICRRENLLRWLPSNKQKSSSDYLPDAFQINPCFAPNFGISWRRKKKLTLTPDDVRKLCSGTDEEWKKVHSHIERQYHPAGD